MDDYDLIWPCEYAYHGQWGPNSAPGAYFADLTCPVCGGCDDLQIMMCSPCLSGDRLVRCGECSADLDPRTSWKILFRW